MQSARDIEKYAEDYLDALNAMAEKLPEYAAEIWINGVIS